jgi:hypothetical protein
MDINSILMAHGVIRGGGGVSSKDTVPPPPITNFNVDSVGDGFVSLSWTNPDDTDFAGVKIQRKESGYPSSPTDGATVYDGLDSTVTDSGLTNSVEYFYRAFTYDFDDNFNQDVGQQVSGMPTLADDTSGSAGNDMLVAGTMEAGYFGTVPSSEFFTGSEIASEVGISEGALQHDTTDWIKYAYKSKICFTPLKPIRRQISYDTINAAKCVDGTTKVVKNQIEYSVRLMTGEIGQEWDNIMYGVHVEQQPNWAQFTDEDLLTDSAYGGGSATWCSEKYEYNALYRGFNGVTHSDKLLSSATNSADAWRPVLELVQ